jgi:hypothetical protein
MTWVLIAAFGCAAWILAAWFFLALCRAAGQADHVQRREGTVIDLHAFREFRAAAQGGRSANHRPLHGRAAHGR